MTSIEHARAFRQRSTPAECEVWRWLRNRYLQQYKFRRQHPLGKYILDFYCPQLKLCIELDGRAHNTNAGALRDALRTEKLVQHGITVLRFWNDDIKAYPDQCWERIVEVVERLKHPSP